MLDVIYLKDGSVLKGTLVKHNFSAGLYTIETQTGLVFEYSRTDILRITKEPSESTHIQAQTTPSPPQGHAANTNEPYRPYNLFYVDPAENIGLSPHIISLGYSSYNFSFNSDDYAEGDYLYTGNHIAYQYNATENLSIYTQYLHASLRNLGPEDIPTRSVEVPSTTLKMLSSLVIYGNRNLLGFQYHGGAGAFWQDHTVAESFDAHDTDKSHKTYYGLAAEAGFGYRWKPLDLQVRWMRFYSPAYQDGLKEQFDRQFKNSTSFNVSLGLSI